jgi:hypothetical protein
MYAREGCRQWSETEPVKYWSLENVRARKAQIAARPQPEDIPWRREDELALEKFRIFFLVDNYDGHLAYRKVVDERTREFIS